MGRPVGDQFADLFDGDQIPVDFPVQGGQFLTLWGRFYTPSGVDHWWTHLDLIHKDSREELGSVDWYVTPCEGGWADVYLRLEVQPTAEGPCQMTVQHELFDASENVLGTIEDEVDVEVLNSMSGGS